MFRYLFVLLVFIFSSYKGFSQENTEKEPVYEFVDEAPSPIGGMKEYYSYVAENIKYPKKATENNIQGTVYLEVIIGKDGKPKDIVILKNIGGGCGEEAKRVIENMPAWNPGKQNGRPVEVRIKLPIKFILEDNNSKNDKKRKRKK